MSDPLGIVAIAEARVLRQAAAVVEVRERPAASFEELDQALDGLRQASRHLDRVRLEERRVAARSDVDLQPCHIHIRLLQGEPVTYRGKPWR